MNSLPILLGLFTASGCAALIYEVVWFQLLQLVIGSSAISLGLLLAIYMGGLCLGSMAVSSIVSAKQHPLRIYALLELGIGVLGVLVLASVPLMSRLYVAGPTQGSLGIVLRGIVSAICLLPPTILMGATLPVISRWVKSTRDGMAQLGSLYAANIGGAVLGCFLAGFYLLRVYDLRIATYVAVVLNLLVSLAAFILARRTRRDARTTIAETDLESSPGSRLVYLAIGLSGLAALGAQVVWTRLLSFLLGVTVYTFSIILAVFLVGLGAGAGIGSFVARRTTRPRLALGVCQILLSVCTAWTAFMLTKVVPYWPIDPWLALSPWSNFQLDLLRAAPAILPATVLWGASFPLALAALAGSSAKDAARPSGTAYAANSLGAVAGALLFTLLFIPVLGTMRSQQVLIGISVLAATVMLVSWRSRIASVILMVLLVWTVSDVPWHAVAYGHRIASTLRAFQLYPPTATHVLYKGEGLSSSIVIAESNTGQRSYHVNGKTEATTALEDMRLQRMLGHIPALLHPNPRSVLSWGFGAGVTAGSFVVHPGIEQMVICELEPLAPPASTTYFGKQNYNVMNDSRTRVVYDDARHYLLTSKAKYDVITSDPLDPWAKGTATLYTREFFTAVKEHLNPGGIFGQFVQLYESNEAAVKSELATFLEAFPNATVWSNYANGQGYDLVLLGQKDPTAINVDALQERLERADHARVSESLSEIGFHSAVELLATYVGRAGDFAAWLKDAEINSDVNLRLQYVGGLGINAGTHENIYSSLLKHRRFPQDLFVGESPRMEALRTLVLARRQ